jgi:hypothetical protein
LESVTLLYVTRYEEFSLISASIFKFNSSSKGFKDPDAPTVTRLSAENSILDYQTQQYRLFKQLAISYGFVFTGKFVAARMKELQKEFQVASIAIKKIFHLLMISPPG